MSMKEPRSERFRTYTWPGIVFLIVVLMSSCADKLSDARAIELIRLNYKQQNSTEGAGTWLIDSVFVNNKLAMKGDTVPAFKVTAYISGIYKVPVIEDAPQGFSEKFYDTLQFVARKFNKVWMADDWTVIGSKHE